MDITAKKLDQLTGREFFKPKAFKNLGYVYDDLLEEANKRTVVLVGGTNGKGETCYSLEWCASQAGIKSAMFTSPHLYSVHERIRFNQLNIQESDLLELLVEFENKYPGNSCNLSYFELCFWLFLKYAIKKNSDLIICEVGLGGRLDITNLLQPTVSIITNVSRDHTEYLGSTYKKILYEKLGITRKGVRLFTGTNIAYLRHEINQFSSLKKFPVSFVELGKNYSETNKFMALKVFRFLFKDESFLIDKNVLLESSVDPRVKVFSDNENAKTYFYGAHNLDGHRNLIKRLENNKSFHSVILSFSNRPNIEIESILKLYNQWLGPEGSIFVNTNSFFKSGDSSRIKSIVHSLGLSTTHLISSFNDLKGLLRREKDCLWVGSYYSCEILGEIFE